MTDQKKDDEKGFFGSYTKEELEEMERRRAERAGMTLEEYRDFQRRRPKMIDLEVEEIDTSNYRPIIA